MGSTSGPGDDEIALDLAHGEASSRQLFPNEDVGLNLPFAVGLVLVELDRAAGQRRRFFAFYKRGFESGSHVGVVPDRQDLYKFKLVISDARASFGKEVAYRSRARDGRCAGRH